MAKVKNKKLKTLQNKEKKISFLPALRKVQKSTTKDKNAFKRDTKRTFKETKLELEKMNNTRLSKKQKLNLKNLSLRERMMMKLQAARFRFLNEELYSTSSKQGQRLFESDPAAFKAYHEGYQHQVSQWPVNPLDVIIEELNKKSKDLVIADFGCGEARLAESVSQKVHSLDLVATKPSVIACDMANTPLESQSIDVVVFCLSLMGTNIQDFLFEANRVLRDKGLMMIAEVETRFENVDSFIEAVERFGFQIAKKNFSNNLFYFFTFRKVASLKSKKKLPTVSLHPCVYKKR